MSPEEQYSSALKRGHRLVSMGRAEQAIESFSEALSIQPNSVEAMTEIARCKMVLKDYQDAHEVVSAALQLDANDLDALIVLCYTLNGLGKVKRAYKVATELAGLAPGNAAALTPLCVMAYDLNHRDEAQQVAELILSIDVHQEVAHYVLGRIAADDQDWLAAKAHYEDGLRINGESAFLLRAIGEASEQLSCYGDAVDFQSSVLFQAPGTTAQQQHVLRAFSKALFLGRANERIFSLAGVFALTVTVTFGLAQLALAILSGSAHSAGPVNSVTVSLLVAPWLCLGAALAAYKPLLSRYSADQAFAGRRLLADRFGVIARRVALLVLVVTLLSNWLFGPSVSVVGWTLAIVTAAVAWLLIIANWLSWCRCLIEDLLLPRKQTVASAWRWLTLSASVVFTALMSILLYFAFDNSALPLNEIAALWIVGLMLLWLHWVKRSPLGAAMALLVASMISGVIALDTDYRLHSHAAIFSAASMVVAFLILGLALPGSLARAMRQSRLAALRKAGRNQIPM